MAFVTEALFREDGYLAEAEAEVLHVNERGGIILDRTVFYATSGGQPGDTGKLMLADGRVVDIAATITGETKDEIIHVPATDAGLAPGDRVKLQIDWERRLKLMRMHTACHLLTVVCPYPITGASVSPSCVAASTRPCPAISSPSSATRQGTVQPNSAMLAAILATWSAPCTFAFLA